MAGARRNTHPSHLRSTAWELIRFEPVRDVRPKYARKQPKSASAFNCPRYSTCCYAQLPASFTNFLHYCSPSPGFMRQGKNRGRRTDNPSGCHPIRTIGAPPPSSPIFMPNALTVATLATYPG